MDRNGIKRFWPTDGRSLEPASLQALRNQGVKIDAVTQVDAWMEEWGSAVAAVRAASFERFKGRKPEWLKALEEAADEERRREVEENLCGTYEFSHISRIPVVPVEFSVLNDCIVCLIDGSERTVLSRHLRSKYKMSPWDYIMHFGLPLDYPMAAANCRSDRSRLAHGQWSEVGVSGFLKARR
jgi:hypothetical protein